MKKLNFKQLSQKYNAILINNWEQLKQALDNGKLVMALDKKEVVHTSKANKRNKKTTKELLEDFKTDIVNIFKDEITKVNNRIDMVDKRINTLETNINNRLDMVDKRLDNLVRLNHLVE